MGDRHQMELAEQTNAALEALGPGANVPAFDAFVDLDEATAAAAVDGPVLVRAHVELSPAREERFSAVPADGVWLLLRGAETAPTWCGWREQTVRSGTQEELKIVVQNEPCCDQRKCERSKCAASLWLHCGETRLLLAEVLEHSEDAARGALKPLRAALQKRLFTSSESSRFEGAEKQATDDEAIGVEALQFARWSLRREGELYVLRDHGRRGPRESATRHGVAALLLFLLTAGSGYATWVFVQQADWSSAGVWGVLSVVLGLATFAWLNIARWAFLYRATSEVLCSASRDRFVLQPWCGRGGEVDVKPEGRFGAGLEVRAFEGWRIQEQQATWALICDTDHGAYPVANFPSEALARRMSQALERAFEAVRHAPVVAKAKKRKPADASTVAAEEPGTDTP